MDLIEREVGQIPVSIGTSLAFEGILGIHPAEPKQPIDVKSVKEIWVNLRTLARNLWSAVSTSDVHSVNPRDAVEILLNEVQTIPVALLQANSKIKVRYYIASTDEVKWLFPKAAFKEAKTPKQMAYEVYERYAAIELLQRMKEENIEVMEIARKPPRADGTVALLTHFPHELLWKEHFNRLLLLESHTGKIKPYQMWYTKLHGIKADDQQLPFTKFTLQVFGDGVLLEPQSKAIKGQLKQLAKTRKWTPVTTQDKLYHDIQTHGSKELKEAYALLR
ncbi:hypothetical protein AVT69_gp061 [Pseudomonas phage PhiPA3]|uniref:Uncharacterized protein 060 n=1 Tax=Pseudomonas phage PhiPA3 TaxID=998086 RepID=F8SJU2_BPPA3|nr:hypothetical protein AVT69_gp061 [Pseudomonas phage PhiPA3]AEH03487.1 hypothetical protein [Pseudomonas phage PhiPA3]